MTPFGDSSYLQDERSSSAPPPFLAKREVRERPATGTAPTIYRHRRTAERVLPVTQHVHDEDRDDTSLVFDAIYDAFLAQRVMLCAFAALRGEDGAESLW